MEGYRRRTVTTSRPSSTGSNTSRVYMYPMRVACASPGTRRFTTSATAMAVPVAPDAAFSRTHLIHGFCFVWGLGGGGWDIEGVGVDTLGVLSAGVPPGSSHAPQTARGRAP